MAIGVLGSATVAAGGGTVTVYTVPAIYSHAVVHITMAGYGSVSAGGAQVLVAPPGSSAADTKPATESVSMMLSPGSGVQVRGAVLGSTGCTVSGYEVLP